MGFAADIIVWDLQARTVVHRMSLHKVKVAELVVLVRRHVPRVPSAGRTNSLVIWDVATGNAICGTPTPGLTKLPALLQQHANGLSRAGEIRWSWDFDLANRKLRPSPCRMGSIRRDTNYIVDDEDVSARPSRRHGTGDSEIFFFPDPAASFWQRVRGRRARRFRFVGERGLGPASSPDPFAFPPRPPRPFRDPRLIRMSTCTSAPPPATCCR